MWWFFHSLCCFFTYLTDIKRINAKGPQSWQTFLFKVVNAKKKSIKMHVLCKVLQAPNLKKPNKFDNETAANYFENVKTL